MNSKTIKRLLTYCRPYRVILGLIFILSFISVCLTLITPILFGQAIDLLIGIGLVDFSRLFWLASSDCRSCACGSISPMDLGAIN